MHKSVLLEECIDNLNLNDNSIIVDCTLGYAGHSSEILKRIPKGFLYAFDQDEDAIRKMNLLLEHLEERFPFHFPMLDQVIHMVEALFMFLFPKGDILRRLILRNKICMFAGHKFQFSAIVDQIHQCLQGFFLQQGCYHFIMFSIFIHIKHLISANLIFFLDYTINMADIS